ILEKHNIKPKVMFYGIEDIATKNIFWRMFSLLRKVSPNFVQFYNLPASKLHGITTRVEM
ncbi:MAG: hypothetical protein OEV59_09525, partial [Deltaproteobacteria bacterium]|nr:hypothetical protein [Deltaproteobacteria bacterium]